MPRTARVWRDWPALFNILEEPDRMPVDYGVKLFTLVRKLDPKACKALLDRADDLVDNGERFTPGEALVALQVEASVDAAPGANTDEQPKTPREDIFGHDDQPIGHAETLADSRLSIVLPPEADVLAMSATEREESAARS